MQNLSRYSLSSKSYGAAVDLPVFRMFGGAFVIYEKDSSAQKKRPWSKVATRVVGGYRKTEGLDLPAMMLPECQTEMMWAMLVVGLTLLPFSGFTACKQ